MARTTRSSDAVRGGRPLSPARASTLARTCDCGNHASGGTCPACAAEARRKRVSRFADRGQSQAETGAAREDAAVPSIVHDVLGSSGQPLPGGVRAFMEPRFGADFSDVRLHTDSRAAQSSRAVSAQAYTAGSHIVFDAGRFQPETGQGQRLLAHELTHVVQQRGGSADASTSGASASSAGASSGSALRPDAVSDPGDAAEREAETNAARVLSTAPDTAAPHAAAPDTVARRTRDITQPGAGIQRLSGVGVLGLVGGAIAVDLLAGALGAFDRDVYTAKELQAYLDRLAQRRTIEGKRNSDNKARDVVRHYRSGDELFDLDKGYRSAQGALSAVDVKRLLALEMLDGWPGDDDQKAILTLVGRTTGDDLLQLLDPAKGLTVNVLDDQLQGENHIYLKAYLDTHFPKGSTPWDQVNTEGGCNVIQALMILKAREAAVPRVAHTIAALDHADDPTIRSIISCYFPLARAQEIAAIKAIFVNVATQLPLRDYYCQPVTASVAGGGEATLKCGGGGDTAVSWVDLKNKTAEPEVVLCSKFFKLGPEQQAITVMHEAAHASGAMEDVLSEVKCGQLQLADALQNAESYAYLASALFARAAIPAAKPAAPPKAGGAAGGAADAAPDAGGKEPAR